MATIVNSRHLELDGTSIRTTDSVTTISASISGTPVPKNETALFYKQLDNSVLPGTITLIADTQGLTSPITFVWSYASDLDPSTWTVITGQTTSTLSITNTNYVSYLGAGKSVIFKVECSKVGFVSSSANYTVYYYKESDEVVQVSLDNPFVNVPANSLGNPTSTSGTGTGISVTINGTPVYYGTSGPNTFSIGTITQNPSSSVGLGSASPVDTKYVYSDITGLTANTATVTFPVIVRNKYGTVKPSVSIQQKFTKIINDAYLDTTPPPTPTGVTITAGFTSIFIKHDNPTYTVGKGHGQTIVYGVEVADNTVIKIFSDAVNVAQFNGSTGTLETGTSKAWRIWLKWRSKDGYESTTPFGGTNGFYVKTTTIGNTDLGPLVVEAANLATGAVSASKLAANAVELTKFASGIEPVSIVSSIPSTKSTSSIFNTADGKLYRWNGSSYIASIPATDLSGQITTTQITDNAVTTDKIVANAITAGKIQAGAIGAAQIAAGAITTDKLLVTGRGQAINDDPGCQDISNWQYGGHGDTATRVTISDGVFGTSAFRSTTGTSSSIDTAKLYPVSSGKKYRLSAWFRRTSNANGTIYLRLVDQVGNQITLGVEAQTPTTSWQKYATEFTPTTSQTSVRLRAILNWTGSAGYHEVADIRLEEKAEADLIVDGAIIASKLAANSIAVGTAAIQNGAIVNAMIADATIGSAKIASLDAGKITTGTLDANRIAANSITASQINSNGLTIKDNAGNVILGVGTNLDSSRVNAAAGWLNSNIGLTVNSNGTITTSGGPSASGSVTFSGLGTTGVIGSGNIAKNGDFLLSSGGLPTHFANYNNAGISLTNQVFAGGPIQNSNYWRIIVNASGSSEFGFYFNSAASSFGGWKANTNYVVSFYARCNNHAGSTFFSAWNQGPAVNTALQNPGISSSWQRYVWLINFVNNTIDGNGFWAISQYNLAVGTQLDFACIQVEQGDAPSGWAPTPVSTLSPIDVNNITTYISGAAIGNAQIANLDAGKINAGTIDAARIAANSITADKIDSRNLTIRDANDNIIFSAGTNLDYSRVGGTKPPADADKTSSNTAAAIAGQGSFATLSQINSSNISSYIAAAAIGSAYIGDLDAGKINAGSLKVGSYIQSSNYASGSAGWKINSDGNAEFEGIVIRRNQRVAFGQVLPFKKFGLVGTPYPTDYGLDPVTILIDTGYPVEAWFAADIKSTWVLIASPGNVAIPGGGVAAVSPYAWSDANPDQTSWSIITTIENLQHKWKYTGASTIRFNLTLSVEGINTAYLGPGATNVIGIEIQYGIGWGLYKLT